MRRTLSSVLSRFVLITVVMCLGLAVFAAVAFAGSANRVAGTVYNSADQPFGSNQVAVYLYKWDGASWAYYDWRFTDSTGGYSFDSISAGEYHVYFAPQDNLHADQYYDDRDRESVADTLIVAADTVIEDLDAHLHLGGTITGTLTDEPTGLALYNLRADLYEYRADSGTWEIRVAQNTDGQGVYEFARLPQGTYRVEFSDTAYGLYVGEFWADAAELDAADDIPLAWGETRSDIDAVLARGTGTGNGASISGQVTAEETGWELADTNVTLYWWNGADWHYLGDRTTDANGRYLWTGLAAGDYRLRFEHSSGHYVAEYFDDAADLASGTTITLAEDQVATGKDAQLRLLLNAVTGTVTDEVTHEPLPGIYVELSYDWGAYAGFAYTDEFGRYEIAGLTSNTYKIRAYDTTEEYFSEYYSDAREWDSATPLELDGSSAAIVDFGLQHAGEISGVITSKDTELPIAYSDAFLYRYVEASDTWDSVNSCYGDATGEYHFVGLEYGTYRLRFADETYGHLPEYYNDSAGLLDATDIEITATPVVIDAALAKGGTITGTVTGSADEPLAGAEVSLWLYSERWDTWYQDGGRNTALTNAQGEYTLSSLPDGTYRVRAFKSGRCAEYFDQAATVGAATSLAVTAPATIENVDFTLDVGSTISGHVEEVVTGTPIQSTYVALTTRVTDAYGSESWQQNGQYTYTDASGDYSIANVPPGTYRVMFAHGPTHLTVYYPNERLIWNAQDIVITVPSSVPNIDAQLSTGGAISGTVTDADLTPLQSVYVRVFGYDSGTGSWASVTGAYTDSVGYYSFTALADDSYLLSFSKSGYDGELYDNATDVFGATPVVIENGASVVGRDAALGTVTPIEYGSIEGTVTADSTGLAAPGVHVMAWLYDPAGYGGWYVYSSTYANAHGGYSIDARTGWYRLEFRDEAGRYVTEYHDDVADAADATMFDVDNAETVVRSASLADAASISGRVTGEPTGDTIADISVDAFRHGELGWYYGGQTVTGAEGDYAIGGLEAGTYRVRFSDPSNNWRTEYHDDKPAFSQADETTLAADEDLSGFDASLKRNGRIIGTVTGSDGRAVSDVQVTVYEKTPDRWDYYTQVTTLPDGTYDSGIVEPGTYIVKVTDAWPWGPARYETEYFGDTTRTADAIQLDVTYGALTANVQLDSTGTWGDIAGTVTDAFTGDPIPNMSVRVWYWDDGGSEWYAFDPAVSTDANGDYAALWVPAGADYRVGVDPEYDVGNGRPWEGIYAETYHLDASTVDDGVGVDVTPDALTSAIDIEAAPEATTGYLTSHAIEDGTSTPIAGAHVEFYDYDGGNYTFAGDGYSNAGGSLTQPLPAGQYAVYFDDWPSHETEYYENAEDFGTATLVEVVPAASAEITASLAPLGSIAGTITASTGGAPLEGIEVTVYQLDGSDWNWCYQGYSDALGAYEFVGMPFGTYRVQFRDSLGAYAPEYFDNAASLEEADDIPVGTAPVTGISAALDNAATITGLVTDSMTGDPIENVYARAYLYSEAAGWYEVEGAYVDGLGYYTITGLREGTYRVGFEDWYDSHAYEYYDGVRQVEDGTDVPLVIGEHATGIDATMDRYANLRGTITDVTTGDPIASTYVGLYRWDEDTQEWTSFWGTYSDGNGVYHFNNALPDTYRLYAQRSGYITEYYDNQYDIDSAQDVEAACGQEVTTDMALSPGASIRGNVIDPASDPVENIAVTALRWSAAYGQWVSARTVYTGVSGDYDLDGLGDGIYRINFYDSTDTFAEEYYNDAPTIAGAQDVELANGEDTVDINAQLASWVSPGDGQVAGTTRSDAGGSPLEDIQVVAKRYIPSSGWDPAGVVLTAHDGTYSMALEAGTYRFEFRDDSGEYLNEYYDDVRDGEIWDADDVTVSAGATSSVDASLAPGAHLRGTVTAAVGGSELEGIYVSAYRFANGAWDWTEGAYTDSLGDYDIGTLPLGTYVVEFTDYSYTYRTEYYDDAPDMDAATQISLGMGETRSGIDAALGTNGVIAGRVTDEATGRPVLNARVVLYVDTGSGSYVSQNTPTESDGTYEFTGLSAGTYFIYADDAWSSYGFQRYTGEFFDNQPDEEDATRFVITTNSETADLALESTHTWGSISGTVLDSVSGYPVPGMPVELYEPDGLGGWAADNSYLAWTDSSGGYRLDYVPLSADAYRIAADPGLGGPTGLVYDLTFYSSASTVELGSDVDLSLEAHLAGIDILADAKAGVGWVEGTVVSEETSAPLAGINVMFYNAARQEVGEVVTRADGTFSRAVLAGQGPFYLEFSDDLGNYVPEWYDDSDYGTADTVAVTAGETSSITASLTSAARITGTVRNTNGQPIESWVVLYKADGSYVTDGYYPDGTFSFDGLPAGSYKVYAYSTGAYTGEYWENQYTIDTASEIPLATGQTTSIDVTLASGAHFNGTISSDDGLLSSSVAAEMYMHTSLGWEYISSTSTDLGDHYEWISSALPAGEYRVLFSETFGNYEPIWYGSTPDIDTATSIWLDAGETLTLDQMLDKLPPTVNSDAVASYDNEASVEITATDLASGVERIHYLLGAEYHSVEATHATVLFDSFGYSQSIEFWATDNMGHDSDHQLVQFDILDTIAPTVTDDAEATYPEHAAIGLVALDTCGRLRCLGYLLPARCRRRLDDGTGRLRGHHHRRPGRAHALLQGRGHGRERVRGHGSRLQGARRDRTGCG